MSNETLTALVSQIRYEAEGIISIELRPEPGAADFPAFTAGSHIDLNLPNGMVRSYSLYNSPAEPNRYVVGILRDKKSRGGSEWVHRQLRVGTRLAISAPRNNFPLQPHNGHSVLVAGGIGITPVLCMFRELLQQGQSAELIYCARTRSEAAFIAEIEALTTELGGTVRFRFDDEAGTPPNLEQLLQGQAASTHFYCCGPTPMLDAFEAACAQLNHANVHIERFAAVEIAASDDARSSYVVELARSGQIIQINPGDSLLERLEGEGLDLDCSCREGVCGACEVAVLEGEIDHRDGVLTKAERAANNTMMICVSGCKSSKLVLDI
ncbi:PDR/VanB family oxidoreductase [Oceanobacter sp. 4_MG-2023]|uniref:PDR/VanB family oxidoreductase n=1 Tax=Oceanobacter sp. 4_MG-2023 TaxID=3062623 RepID=UPI0027370295|nr:PDR/VanB family oxidoreductase [Oceanobacter sp. 4_MG-2023]MDP2547220.1 PDR/VanB family oxidoreductase [Oceanobacter sp. 4_MG-2023]